MEDTKSAHNQGFVMESKLDITRSHTHESKERVIISSKNYESKDESPCNLSRGLSLPIKAQTTMMLKGSNRKESGDGGGNVMETRGRFAVTPSNIRLGTFPPPIPRCNQVPNSNNNNNNKNSSNNDNNKNISSNTSTTTSSNSSSTNKDMPSLMPLMEKLLRSSMSQREQLSIAIRSIDPHFEYDGKGFISGFNNTYSNNSGGAREYELLHTVANLQEKVASLSNEVQTWKSKNSRLENQLESLQLSSR